MRIQDLGKTRHDNILVGAANTTRSEKKVQKRNLVHPKSLPRLKEETSLGDLSLKQIIRNQVSNRQLKMNNFPDSVSNSVHKKQYFGTATKKSPPDSTLYSKSELLNMILDNEAK